MDGTSRAYALFAFKSLRALRFEEPPRNITLPKIRIYVTEKPTPAHIQRNSSTHTPTPTATTSFIMHKQHARSITHTMQTYKIFYNWVEGVG